MLRVLFRAAGQGATKVKKFGVVGVPNSCANPRGATKVTLDLTRDKLGNGSCDGRALLSPYFPTLFDNQSILREGRLVWVYCDCSERAGSST